MNLFRDGATKKIKKSILETFEDIGENGIDENGVGRVVADQGDFHAGVDPRQGIGLPITP